MTDYTANEVLAAIVDAFPSEERLSDEYYDDVRDVEEPDYAGLAKRYLEENEYASAEDLIDWSELAYELRENAWHKPRRKTITLRGEEVELKCVQQLGGMDEGTTADVTFKVGDQYFTKRGWYQSHYGYEYDGDFEETVPKQRPVEYDYVRKS